MTRSTLAMSLEGTGEKKGAASGVARLGNSDPLYLVVSVTDADGVPVSTLAAANLSIEARIVAA
jgi:hypothetical protein